MLGLLGARGGAVSGLVMLRLDDPDAAVREAAAAALPRIGFHPAALDEIGRMLNHASDARRIDMLRILELFGSSAQASAVLIVPLLKSPGDEVRQAARSTLRIVGLGRECIKPISLLAHHPQHDIRSAALDLLEECAPAPESCSLALSLMADRDSFLRERAARIISRTGIPPAALPGLRKLLRDERDQVKIMALEALAKAGDASRPASHLVLERMEDASGEVATAAAAAFVATASVEECAGDISRVLHNRRQDRRLLMLGCLRRMGVAAAPALPLVTASMGDPDWPVRDAACEAFIAIGFHDTCLPEVRRLIEHQDRNYRLAIIKALGACGMNASAAEQFLSQRQGDIDAEVGRAARKRSPQSVEHEAPAPFNTPYAQTPKPARTAPSGARFWRHPIRPRR
jgi:HEAT repeat protein